MLPNRGGATGKGGTSPIKKISPKQGDKVKGVARLIEE